MEYFDIAAVAERSGDFRRVLWAGRHSQLVIMTIPPDGEIGRDHTAEHPKLGGHDDRTEADRAEASATIGRVRDRATRPTVGVMTSIAG